MEKRIILQDDEGSWMHYDASLVMFYISTLLLGVPFHQGLSDVLVFYVPSPFHVFWTHLCDLYLAYPFLHGAAISNIYNIVYKNVIQQGPDVQKVDNAIHWIKLYPGDNTIDFPNTYPLDSASAIQHLNNRSQTISAFKSRIYLGYIWSLKMYHCLFAALQSTLKPITPSKSLFCAKFTLYKDRQGTHKIVLYYSDVKEELSLLTKSDLVNLEWCLQKTSVLWPSPPHLLVIAFQRVI